LLVFGHGRNVNVIGVEFEWTNEAATPRNVVDLSAKLMIQLS
jgi:hypothetical protein